MYHRPANDQNDEPITINHVLLMPDAKFTDQRIKSEDQDLYRASDFYIK
jgi:hypothetical protein